jgi:glutamine amidotransferase
MSIVIVDYGLGNLRSIGSKLEAMKIEAQVSSSPQDILRASKLILPGVGHFATGMKNLKSRDLIDPLNEATKQRKTPILGICLGMQLMSLGSEEGDAAGLSWFDCTAKKTHNHEKKRVAKT